MYENPIQLMLPWHRTIITTWNWRVSQDPVDIENAVIRNLFEKNKLKLSSGVSKTFVHKHPTMHFFASEKVTPDEVAYFLDQYDIVHSGLLLLDPIQRLAYQTLLREVPEDIESVINARKTATLQMNRPLRSWQLQFRFDEKRALRDVAIDFDRDFYCVGTREDPIKTYSSDNQ